jgi:peptidoglycan/xylan/chitin deacetylase (PgdA/CDA1 family)
MAPSWISSHQNDGKSSYRGRDVVGYGPNPPKVEWPGGARVALNFVINYEEGGERCLLHGDTHSESLLSEIVGAAPCRKYFRTLPLLAR